MTQKLDVGKVFSRIFELYTSQASLYLPAALLLFIPAAIINGLIRSGSSGFFVSIAVGIINLAFVFVYEGLIVQSVRDLQDGRRDLSMGQLFSSVTPVLGQLIVVGIVAAIAIDIGFIFILVPGIILMTIWAVFAPVIVVERRGFDALGRSYELVRGNFWPVLGVIVVMIVLQIVVSIVLAGIAIGISDSFVVIAIFLLIGSVLIAPLDGLARAVMYFELLGLGRQPAAAAGPPGATGAAPPPAPPAPSAPPPPPPEQQPPPG
jgi:hypothetical protein